MKAVIGKKILHYITYSISFFLKNLKIYYNLLNIQKSYKQNYKTYNSSYREIFSSFEFLIMSLLLLPTHPPPPPKKKKTHKNCVNVSDFLLFLQCKKGSTFYCV